MGGKSMKMMLGMAIFAVVAMPILYLASVQHLVDTDAPRVAALAEGALSRHLDAEEDVRLTMHRLEPGLDSTRHYVLHLTPSDETAQQAKQLDALMRRGARLVQTEVKSERSKAIVTCVAHLPDGSAKRLTFDRSLALIDEPPRLSNTDTP